MPRGEAANFLERQTMLGKYRDRAEPVLGGNATRRADAILNFDTLKDIRGLLTLARGEVALV